MTSRALILIFPFVAYSLVAQEPGSGDFFTLIDPPIKARDDRSHAVSLSSFGLGKTAGAKLPVELLDAVNSTIADAGKSWGLKRDEIRSGHVAKLEALMKDATTSEQLAKAVAIREEIARVKTGGYADPTKVTPLPEFGALRLSGFRARSAADHAHAKAISEAIREYGRTLTAERVSLVQNREIEHATEVDKEIKLAEHALAGSSEAIAYLAKVASAKIGDFGGRSLPQPLAEGLKLYYGFDSLENAGLAWSHRPFGEHSLQKATSLESGWRKAANFRANQSALIFKPNPVELGPSWTVAFWVNLPVKTAYVFTMSGGGHPAIIIGNRVEYWSNKKTHILWRPPVDEFPRGWTFFALVFEAGDLRLYANGHLVSTGKADFKSAMRYFGNRPGTHGHWSMISDLDDLFLYGRPLTSPEIRDLHFWTNFAP